VASLARSPRVHEELRPPSLAVVSPDSSSIGGDALDGLASLPCVVVGDGHDPNRPPAHVDVVVDPTVAGLNDILATVEANPIAATTLALLLRGSTGRSLAEGLVAESAAYSVLQAGPEFQRWRDANTAKQRAAELEPPVLVERDGDVLRVALNRPHVRNALNRAMRDALLDAFALADADETITSVELRGNGPVFSSGGDLDEFGTFDDPASAHLVRLAASLARSYAAVADRLVVFMHGACAGSGVELPAFAHRVVAAPDTTFALPEVGLGLVPGAGGTVSLVERVGRHRVALLALAGKPIDSATALAWGLVDEVA